MHTMKHYVVIKKIRKGHAYKEWCCDKLQTALFSKDMKGFQLGYIFLLWHGYPKKEVRKNDVSIQKLKACKLL